MQAGLELAANCMDHHARSIFLSKHPLGRAASCEAGLEARVALLVLIGTQTLGLGEPSVAAGHSGGKGH